MALNSFGRRLLIPLMLAMPAMSMNWSDQLHQADQLDASGQHQQAVALYQAILADQQPNPSAHMVQRVRLRLARSQLALGRFDGASASLGPLLEYKGANWDEAHALARSIEQIDHGSNRLLLRGLQKIRECAESPWGYRQLADGLKVRGDLHRAFDHIEHALGTPINTAQALAMIDAAKSSGAALAAIGLAEQWLSAHPADELVRASLLRLAIEHAPLEQLVRLHEQSLPLLARPTRQRFQLAGRLASEHELQAALAQYQLVLDDPEFGLESHLAAAALLAQSGAADAATELLLRAIQAWPAAGAERPGHHGLVRSPYTELILNIVSDAELDLLIQTWPALRGVDGVQIRRNLAQARSYLRKDQQPVDDKGARPTAKISPIQTIPDSLISVSQYVLPDSASAEDTTIAARRMIAGVVHWLASSERLAIDQPLPRRSLMRSMLEPVARQTPESIIATLGDSVLVSDLAPAWRHFAADYLRPGVGHLGDDYFRRFVEQMGLASWQEARPAWRDYEQFDTVIEARAQDHALGSVDWVAVTAVAPEPTPDLWRGGSSEEWLSRIADYADLLTSRAQDYPSRLREYWSLLDAPPQPPTPAMASALIRSFLTIDDYSAQQPVELCLRSFPYLLTLDALLVEIEELEALTEYAADLVDLFADDLSEHDLGQMARRIEAAAPDQSAAYRRALESAAADGSQHAAALLARMSGADTADRQ